MRGKTTSDKWTFSRHIMLVDSLFNVQTVIKVNKQYLLPAHDKGGK